MSDAALVNRLKHRSKRVYVYEVQGAEDMPDEDCHEAADRITTLTAEVERLRAGMREIYEVFAGSEGLPNETASEAYLNRLITQMKDIAAETLEPKP